MTHSEIVNWILGLHGSFILILIAAQARYASLSKDAESVLDAYADCTYKLKVLLSGELQASLLQVFRGARPSPSIIVDPSGQTSLSEDVGEPLKSEAFKSSVSRFVTSRSKAMRDLGKANDAMDAWQRWATVRLFTLIAALVIEGLGTATIALVERAWGVEISQTGQLCTLLSIAAFGGVAVFSILRIILAESRLVKLKRSYNDLHQGNSA